MLELVGGAALTLLGVAVKTVADEWRATRTSKRERDSERRAERRACIEEAYALTQEIRHRLEGASLESTLRVLGDDSPRELLKEIRLPRLEMLVALYLPELSPPLQSLIDARDGVGSELGRLIAKPPRDQTEKTNAFGAVVRAGKVAGHCCDRLTEELAALARELGASP